MSIGIPKEILWSEGLSENRVSLSPSGVKELCSAGIEIYVESKAGEGAGFKDEDYQKAGAQIVYSKEEVYGRSDIIVKVSRPLKEKWELLREEQTLLGFLHLAVAPKEFLDLLLSKKITAIGYETIQTKDEHLPILKPMSQIAGKMAVQIAGRLLENTTKGGRGVLLSGVSGVPPAEVVIIGTGTLGFYAARSFAGIGATVYVLGRNLRRLEEIEQICSHQRIITMVSNKHNLETVVKFADVLVTCAYVPGARAPVLITRDMVKTMKKARVIIDFSIDQGGCVETSRLTPQENFVYIDEGIIHFCVPNVPTWVARTASHALSNSIVPYLKEMELNGMEKTLSQLYPLRRGLYTYQGCVTNKNIAKEGWKYSESEELCRRERLT
ncbi:MAG: alanine dehydrogenase [Candidatus Edwardsbacteria bacterium]